MLDSVLKLFTGLVNAAFVALKLTVNKAMATVINADKTNIHQGNAVR